MQDFDPPIGIPEQLEPGLRRIVAPNPSPMTFRGTNTYILGKTELVVIDPGPLIESHLDAIQSACKPDQFVSHIVVSHSHLDHAPLARPLSEATGAPVLGFGDARSGRSAIMQQLAQAGMAGGGEGVDAEFTPDVQVSDGQLISGDGWSLTVLHTPGHMGNHICLKWHDACFTADHVMGWATSLVSPPDGDLSDFMTSCARLQCSDWRVFYPGHGAPVADPTDRLDWLVAHRREREKEILATLREGPLTKAQIARRVYRDIPAQMLPAAERNVFAHLIDLAERSLVTGAIDNLDDALFYLL